MFDRVLRFIKGHIHLDDILAEFHKAVKKLEQFDKQQAAIIAEHDAQIDLLTEAQVDHQFARDRAAKVRANLQKLVEV